MAWFVTALGGLEAALPEDVTALPISHGILLHSPAKHTDVFQQTPSRGVQRIK